MSNDPKQSPKSVPSRPEAVRVRVLRFQHQMDIPGGTVQNSLSGRGPDTPPHAAPRYEIEYQPWSRHHRVAWIEVGKTEPTKVLYVHETQVLSWEAY